MGVTVLPGLRGISDDEYGGLASRMQAEQRASEENRLKRESIYSNMLNAAATSSQAGETDTSNKLRQAANDYQQYIQNQPSNVYGRDRQGYVNKYGRYSTPETTQKLRDSRFAIMDEENTIGAELNAADQRRMQELALINTGHYDYDRDYGNAQVAAANKRHDYWSEMLDAYAPRVGGARPFSYGYQNIPGIGRFVGTYDSQGSPQWWQVNEKFELK